MNEIRMTEAQVLHGHELQGSGIQGSDYEALKGEVGRLRDQVRVVGSASAEIKGGLAEENYRLRAESSEITRAANVLLSYFPRTHGYDDDNPPAIHCRTGVAVSAIMKLRAALAKHAPPDA